MTPLIQTYSLLVVAGALVLILGIVLLRNKPTTREFIAFGTILAVLVAAYFVIRPVQTPLMGEAAAVEAMIGSGKPVLLEFQSPY